jgi:hypothetical protein
MVVSVVGYHADGTETWFHLRSEALDAELQKALDVCRKTGKITQKLLDQLHAVKCHYQLLIEELLEFDVEN